jgi:transposase
MKFIGIDLHTNCFTCCFLDVHGGKTTVTYTITDQGIEDFIKTADLESTVIIEATCNSFAFAQLIMPYVKDVIVANTFELKSISFTDKKTDKVDAYKLARILKSQILSGEEQIHPVVIPPKEIQDLRALFTTYRLERKQVVSVKNRIHSLLKQNLYPFTKEFIFGKKRRQVIRDIGKERPLLNFQINLLFDQLEQLEATIKTLKDMIRESGSSYMKEIDILISMRGISSFTAIAIITDIINVNRFSNSKKFASYLRSTPGISSSNEKAIIKSTSKAGRKQSIVLISQALNHFKDSNPRLHRWNDRLRVYKKPGIVRMGLCRRVITEIYQMLKKGEYHYYMDENNHTKKMAEYKLFLVQRGIIYEDVFHQSA